MQDDQQTDESSPETEDAATASAEPSAGRRLGKMRGAGTAVTEGETDTAQQEMPFAYVDGKVYAIGGRGYEAGRIFVYDVAKKSWSIARFSNPDPRSSGAAVVVGHSIYLIGGLDSHGASSRVDILDVSRGVFRRGPALPVVREGHVAALVDGKIHVTGGQSISPPKSYADHFVLDLTSDKWSREAPLPTARHGSVAAGAHGKFFVIGGAPGAGVYTVFTSSDVVDIYSNK